MLLRSISKHVKDQNWFAIGIDFVIVVVGVFLGLQIGDWNNQRLQHERTVVLSERLANDFGVDIWIASDFLQYNKTVFKNAKLVLADLSNQERVSDEKLLVAAFRATQFNRFIKSPTYKELIASGGYELLAASKLGQMATMFYETNQAEDIQNHGQTSGYRYLYRSIMPIDVQLQAAKNCGDRTNTLDNLINSISMLSYDCELTLSEIQLSEAVAVLRSNPEIATTLRHRIANLSIQIRDFEIMIKSAQPFRVSKEVLANSPQIIYYGIE